VLPSVIADTRADERTAGTEATVRAGVGTYVGVPLTLSDGSTYGTFCCLSHESGAAPEGHDLKVMRVLGRLVVGEIEREAAERARLRLEIEANASQALVAALEARENYTGGHSRSVLELSLAVGRELGLGERELTEVGQVALLHDIGKVGVPDAVLRKPGPLDESEWAIMREHPTTGARIVASIDGLAHLAPAIGAEHERWDGDGYPAGLAGTGIPLASRICLICDAYDAMVTDRPYRPSLGYRRAVAELRAAAGSQFDPELVDVLLRVLSTHPLSGAAVAAHGAGD
jgi:HD-GYP domain-containing protein (c-di-GMP phosphodiesterase class II)